MSFVLTEKYFAKKFIISLFTFHFSGIQFTFSFKVQSSISHENSVFGLFGTTFIFKISVFVSFFSKFIKNILKI
jgi:hypothetical protein